MHYQGTDMLNKFSISDAAIAYNKPRSTIMKYIRNGYLRLDYYKLIEYNQLVDLFGELPTKVIVTREEKIQNLKKEIDELKEQIEKLKTLDNSDFTDDLEWK